MIGQVLISVSLLWDTLRGHKTEYANLKAFFFLLHQGCLLSQHLAPYSSVLNSILASSFVIDFLLHPPIALQSHLQQVPSSLQDTLEYSYILTAQG